MKKINKMSIVTFVIGLILCVGLCLFGISKENKIKKINSERYDLAVKRVEEEKNENNKKIEELQTEIDAKQKVIDEKLKKCRASGASTEKYLSCVKKAKETAPEVEKLKGEKETLENTVYDLKFTQIESIQYQKFYYIGAVVLVLGIIFSLIINSKIKTK